ncbi:MAG: aldo/keto reductase [Campylobacterales bacterium]|nr:aldo/keto reductase [Campylobacterales bacterium]
MNSKLAFGTYRTGLNNPEHEAALILALKKGIRLIDTSTNYMNGDAERLIAKVLEKLYGGHKSDDLEIVSKCGYIQGSLLEEMKKLEEKTLFELDVVKYSEHCYHCIHPGFIKAELAKSLERLKLEELDCYLLHNPEYYLMSSVKDEEQKEEAQIIMLDRILDAFMQLEEEVKAGRICSYGISSNSFSLPPEALYFLPYTSLIDLAAKAAYEVGNEKHHFTTLQMPINLLEKEGLHCARWAKRNGLRVLANRPLNASKDNLMFRLATALEPAEYYGNLNELLGLLEELNLTSLFNLVGELDNYKHRFGWIGEYQAFLMGKIIPHIRKELIKIGDDNTRESISQLVSEFLISYEAMVLHECSKQTKSMLEHSGITIEETIEKTALNDLISTADIDYVLVGMRKEKYVDALVDL